MLGLKRSESNAAVADRKRGHAVPARGRAVWVPVNLGIVVRMKVDVSGRYDLSAGVQHLRRVTALEAADLGNFPVFNPDVGLIARHPRTVDDHAVLNNGVAFRHGGTSIGPALRVLRSLLARLYRY